MKKFFTLIAAAFALTASAQLAGGDYFIKNVETGKYLNGGNFWGTKASVTDHAQIMSVGLSDGKYAIDSHISNGNGRNFLAAGEDCYVDAAIAYHTIEAVDGGYSIMDSNDKYLETTDGNLVYFKGTTPQVWQFLTKADYIAEAVAKVKDGGMADLTGLIPDANFSRNNQDISLWTGASLMGKGGPNDAVSPTQTGMNAEKWGGNSSSIDFGTKVEGLPNGKYVLSFQGFYRYNNTTANTNDVAIAAHADGTEQIFVNLYVNDTKTPFLSVADDDAMFVTNNIVPFSQKEAAEAFSKGAYMQYVDVEVTDGTLSLKVEKLEKDHPGCDWTVLDNLELYLVELAEEADYTVYAKVTADGLSKNFDEQDIHVSVLGGVATVTLPAAQAGPYTMEEQSVKVKLAADGAISMVDGQTLNFKQGTKDIVATVTSVAGALAEGKVNVTVEATGDNGKDVKVVYSSDPIVDPQPENVTLTKEMFKTWTSAGADAEPAAVQSSTWCDYVLNESTGMPYGNGNVDWMQYADLSEYKALVVVASAGTPRFFLNRKTADGQAPDNAIDTNNANHFATYVTKTDNGDGTFTFTLDVAKVVQDQGFAHLNVIKGGNWGNTTVLSMELVPGGGTAADAVVAAPAKAIVKYVENGKIVIVKNGKKYTVAGAQM